MTLPLPQSVRRPDHWRRREMLTPHRVSALKLLERHGTLTLQGGVYSAAGSRVRGLVIADLWREGLVDIACLHRGVGKRIGKVATLSPAGRAVIETLMAEQEMEGVG